MKRSLVFGVLFLSTLTLVFNCSKTKDPVSANRNPGLSVHPEAFLEPGSADFHGKTIAANNWNLAVCQECHGTDYSGGIAENSCLTCHENSPEDCVVCHGGTDNITGAPPEDLAGNTDVSARGVGMHTIHLTESSLSTAIACQSCHVVPNTFNASGHIDSNLPVELTFSGLALTGGVNPAWDTNNLTCANSYCHGNWSLAKSESRSGFIYSEDNMTGNNASPIWTDATSAACGTCHGLPPNGHNPFALTACFTCHGTVIDANGTIIDSTKHINGMVNVFSMEYPMF